MVEINAARTREHCFTTIKKLNIEKKFIMFDMKGSVIHTHEQNE